MLCSASYVSLLCDAVQQSIDISCLTGPQQQNCHSGEWWPNDGTDGHPIITNRLLREK